MMNGVLGNSFEGTFTYKAFGTTHNRNRKIVNILLTLFYETAWSILYTFIKHLLFFFFINTYFAHLLHFDLIKLL